MSVIYRRIKHGTMLGNSTFILVGNGPTLQNIWIMREPRVRFDHLQLSFGDGMIVYQSCEELLENDGLIQSGGRIVRVDAKVVAPPCGIDTAQLSGPLHLFVKCETRFESPQMIVWADWATVLAS